MDTRIISSGELDVKVGVGIINYNRADLLEKLIFKVRAATDLKFHLAVADDGSTDESASVCRRYNVPCISGSNRGIAWNKNRAIYHLMNNTDADVILLIENDCDIYEDNWMRIWAEAVMQNGHVNCLHPSTQRVLNSGLIPNEIVGGEGTAFDPYRCGKISGICIGSTRKLVDKVGYLDTRFKGYGHEHAEWTLRFRRVGCGFAEVDGVKYNLMISGGVTAVDVPSSSNKEMISRNRIIMDECKADSLYRFPWRGPDEELAFQNEMQFLAYSKIL